MRVSEPKVFSLKPCIGGWIAPGGKRLNDRQAAVAMHAELTTFCAAVAKHLQFDRCARCNMWGKLEADVFVLHSGAAPICGSADCLCARIYEDYGSEDIISLAILGRHHKLSDHGWHAITSTEPLIRLVREFMDRVEVYHGCERSDPRIRRHFRNEFDEIDAAVADTTKAKGEPPNGPAPV